MVGEGGASAAAAAAAPKPVGKIYSCVCGQAQEVKLYKFASKCRLCNTRPKYLIDDYSAASSASDTSSLKPAPVSGGSSTTVSVVAPSSSASSPSPCPRHRTSSSSSRRKQRQNSTDGSIIVDAASTASESSATSPHRSVRSTVSSAAEGRSVSTQPKTVRRSKTVDCGAPDSDRGLAEMFAPNLPIRRSRSASQRSSTHTEMKDKRGCSCRERKPRRADTEEHNWLSKRDQQLSTHEETTQEQGLYYGTEGEDSETHFPMETQVLTHMVLTDGAACELM